MIRCHQSSHTILRFTFVFLIVCASNLNEGSLPSAFGQAGFLLERIQPQVGQQGTTVVVHAIGNQMMEPQQVLFYQPGIECIKIALATESPSDRDGKLQKVRPNTAYNLTFQISKDAAIGEYQLRIRTKDGLSEMVTFWVTPFKVVAEQHAYVDETDGESKLRNDLPKFAQSIDLNTTVYGFVANYATQDHDWYSVQCKKGQRLSVEVNAARLGFLHYGGMNDPAISIHDVRGNRLARNDDNAFGGQDPVVSIVVPSDGKYLIHMRQQMDYENRLRHYLMHVGSFPRPTLVFPMGIQTSNSNVAAKSKASVALQMLGDAKGTFQQTVDVSGLFQKQLLFEESYFKVLSTGAPQPSFNTIHLSPYESVLESRDRHAPESAQVIAKLLPLCIDGKIESEGEVDWYRFATQKGNRYRVRVYGKTLDSEIDAKIWIRPAKGNKSKRMWEADDSYWDAHDWVGHPYRWQIKDRLDPIVMFDPDQTGEWLIGIADTRREFSPMHAYRIEFQPHVDSAFVHFPPYPSLTTINRDRIVLFRGKTYSRPLSIQRGFGSNYNKPLHIRAIGLPKGVTFSAPNFTQNDSTIPIWFSASSDAEVTAKTFEFVVEPVEETDRAKFRGGFVQVLPATNRRGDYAMYFDKTRKAAIAVCESHPFNVSIERPQIPLLQNGQIDLTIKVDRAASFNDAIYCEMDWLPKGIAKQPPVIIPPEKSSATYTLSASKNVKPQAYPISITARENTGGNPRTGAGLHFISSKPVDLVVQEPFVKIELVRTAIERGTAGEITANIRTLKDFKGNAVLKLGRLPFGVEQQNPFPKITASDKSVRFKVNVTADCLTGIYKDIFCEVAIEIDGKTVRQQTGNGVLRVDEERK